MNNILIVDDKSENLDLLESVLKISGYNTISANNGAEALDLARKDVPDLIISDILMPVMDGFTLCRELKNDEKLCSVPFIFYTATYTDSRDRKFALSLGADRLIVKPTDLNDFIVIVKELLNVTKKKNTPTTESRSTQEIVILKEYNQTLVRKLEDKMLKLEQSEKAIKKNNILLLKKIEEHKRTEEALHNSEVNMRYILKHDPNAIAVFDNNLNYISVSDRYLLDYNVNEKNIIGKHHYEVFPETPQSWKDVHKRCLAGAIERNDNDSFKRPDGSTTYNRWECRPWRRVDGEIGGIITYTEVTTERRQVEMKLQESEERYRNLYKNANIGLYRSLPSGKILMANNELIKMLGFSSFEKLAGRNLEKDGFEQSYERKEFIEKLEKYGEINDFESVWSRQDGSKFFVRESAQVIRDSDGSTLYYDGVVEDITERKLAEDELHASKLFIEEIINSIPVRVFWKDKNLNYLGCNTIFANDAGFSNPLEIIGKDDFQMVWRDQAELYRDDDRNVIETGKSKFFIEEPQTTPEGNNITLLTSKIPLRNSKGDITGLLGTYIDITERKQAEEKIREKDIQFRKLSSAMPDMIFQFTRRTDGTYFVPISSKGIKNIFGCSPEDVLEDFALVGRVIYPDDLARVISDIEYSAKHLSLFTCDFRVQIPGKSIQWIHSKSTPEKLADGSITWYGFNTDITERKLAEDKIRKLYTGIEHSPASVVITDIKGNIEYVNTKFCDITGYDYNEIIGKNPNILKSGEMLKSEYDEMWNIILSGNDWQGEFHNRKKNGELYWEFVSISPIKNENGEVTHFIGIKEDITEKKNMIEELIQAKVKAEEMSRLKSNFLANMSHELRTPLVGILGYADFLRQDAESEEKREMAETIFNSGKRLSETLNLILDLSRFETEKKDIKYDKVDLVSKANEIITLFNEIASKKGLSLKSSFSHDSIIINFDERALHSILNNLINNAIKFTFEGSVITTISHNNDFVEIRVIDTGIGIAKQDYQIIFDEFRQASEGYIRNFEGSGLGLSITKKLVEKYGGNISVESEIGKGSTFTVKLPVTNVEVNEKELTLTEAQIPKTLSEQISVKPIALLVDDDPFVFKVLKRYTSEYIELDSTVDAEFAFQKVKKKQYDLIFMDINLRRGMDGKEATKKIRSMKGYESIPIIATTAYAMLGDKEEFLAAGCSHYLSKPFIQEEIVSLLKEVLKLK